MDFLVFQLQAPMSSWGEPAVGEFRGTAEHASRSALVGLLGAAFGILRDDETAHTALQRGYGFAVGLMAAGTLLRDYQTAQVPPRAALKGRPRATRRDELAVSKQVLSTTLSSRDYRQNGACLVAVQKLDDASDVPSLEDAALALRRPKFVLYLGRKSCPPAAPLWPQLIEADSARNAFDVYAERHRSAWSAVRVRGSPHTTEALPGVVQIAFDEFVNAGVAPTLTISRKDWVIRRGGWRFGDRVEHLHLMGDGP